MPLYTTGFLQQPRDFPPEGVLGLSSSTAQVQMPGADSPQSMKDGSRWINIPMSSPLSGTRLTRVPYSFPEAPSEISPSCPVTCSLVHSPLFAFPSPPHFPLSHRASRNHLPKNLLAFKALSQLCFWKNPD